jgi:hypothetical protein
MVEPFVKTKNGTIIRRFNPFGVGKRIGYYLYIHKDFIHCVNLVFPLAHFQYYFTILKRHYPSFASQFNCVRLDMRYQNIRFDEAPDFDHAREPHIGATIEVVDGKCSEMKHYKSIWHHRWLWIKDGYPGFDVGKAVKWSQKYCAVLNEVPKSSDRTWQAQLAKVGLK